MELVVKGRGVEVTDQLRRTVRHKLDKLSRVEPKAVRVEVEVISERNPRQNGAKRVEATLETPRETFRARAQARDVEVGLDQLVERLERQVRDHREKRRNRILDGANRLKSARTNPGGQTAAE
ncbi:MAG: ribosome-associated translation inhibitor RaiA [Actinomycetota bacterium]|nr:ribosome-associated translation inhibitor RaiA [Actinomycetota bacterium]